MLDDEAKDPVLSEKIEFDEMYQINRHQSLKKHPRTSGLKQR